MTAAIAFEARRCDHIVENDGTVSLMIKIDPADARAFLAVSPDAGGTLFVAPGVRELAAYDPLSFEVDYRLPATVLRGSGFFSARDTWSAIGSDSDFLDWIRDQKCWLSQLTGHVCAGDVVAAHVRRIARGAGVALKPEFSALPLCDQAHTNQHQHGESAIGGKERIDRASMFYVRRWSALTLLAELGYKSWCHVPPIKLSNWARSNSVFDLLPPPYRRASQ